MIGDRPCQSNNKWGSEKVYQIPPPPSRIISAITIINMDGSQEVIRVYFLLSMFNLD
jgi:hypothetical protein